MRLILRQIDLHFLDTIARFVRELVPVDPVNMAIGHSPSAELGDETHVPLSLGSDASQKEVLLLMLQDRMRDADSSPSTSGDKVDSFKRAIAVHALDAVNAYSPSSAPETEKPTLNPEVKIAAANIAIAMYEMLRKKRNRFATAATQLQSLARAGVEVAVQSAIGDHKAMGVDRLQ